MSSVQVSSDKSEGVEGVELLLQSSILQFHLEDDADERDIASLEVISSNYQQSFVDIPTSPALMAYLAYFLHWAHFQLSPNHFKIMDTLLSLSMFLWM
jgi:hypothetical protein